MLLEPRPPTGISGWPRLLWVSGRHHRLITTEELRAAGLSEETVRNRVRAGLLHPKHPKVFAVGHPELTEAGRVLAAVLAYPAGSLLSCLSAAAHFKCHRHPPRRPEVLADTGYERPGTKLRRGRPRKDEVRRVDGVPVTSPGRIAADLARTTPRSWSRFSTRPR